MSPPDQILSILETLSAAYPNRSRDQRTVQLYVERLSDIPVYLLDQAASQHIATSNWFPKIAELRAAAARIAGTSEFHVMGPAPIDTLAAEAFELEQLFWHERTLDPSAWFALADQFERANRPHRAEHTRGKLSQLQTILEEETCPMPET